MLIAPIFHNNYLSPKQPGPNSITDGASTSSSSKLNENPAVKYNILKSAINRGMTFLSKITNKSGSTSKELGSETTRTESSTPSDCSSPDSLKTELIFFKPITREPQTPSISKPVLLRVPSIRSNASSNDRLLSSPCPSPFFIPITHRRESAFSLVNAIEEEALDNTPASIVKPKATKRKNVQLSPQKSPKRAKREVKPAVKTKALDQNLKGKGKTEVAVAATRQTRSMEKKKSGTEFEPPAPTQVKTQVKAAITAVKSKKSSTKKNRSPETIVTRVTRSRSIKQ